jgi:hypothetical protein
MGDLFQRAIRLCVCLCSVRLVRDQTKGRPPLVPLGLGDLCTCTSQLRFLSANTASYLTNLVTLAHLDDTHCLLLECLPHLSHGLAHLRSCCVAVDGHCS